MSFLLDTNIVSQAPKMNPDQAALAWTRDQDISSMYLSVVSLTELRLGIQMMPSGKRRAAFEQWLTQRLTPSFHERILPVSAEIADDCGRLLAACRRAGHQAEAFDALIAATARVHGLSVVTLNRRHFARLQVPLIVPA